VVADLDDLAGIDVVADRELLGGDDALGLVADVEEDLIAFDLDDGALDDVAVLEVAQAVLDRLDELLWREVVLDRGAGWFLTRDLRSAPFRTQGACPRSFSIGTGILGKRVIRERLAACVC
jgi:hypothetical protein